jgi:error-prone DNA polymerase
MPRYAELRCKSNFSFLAGASHPEELVDRAADLGLAALALADRHGIYGAVRAQAQARRRGLPLVVGAELAVSGLSPGSLAGSTVVLLAVDREGYANLCRLVTEAHRGPAGPEGIPLRREEPADLPWRTLAERARGLYALYPGADGDAAARLREAFGRRLALAVARHRVAGEEARLAAARSMGRRLAIPVAVVNDVHTHDRRRQRLQDVLACVRMGTTVARAGRRLFPNAERTLKGPEEMALLWADFPEGLETAAAIADECRFRLEEIRGEHPLPPIAASLGEARPTSIGSTLPIRSPTATPTATETETATPTPTPTEKKTGMDLLRDLVSEGARWRYGGAPPGDVQRQVEKELALVEELGYASYFLTVWDIVRFARERGILCQGRGSAANSAICYLLGITSIDPVRMGLLFERFISAERGEPPDIDVDFEHERREEVIQYVYQRYGREHAGMVCEVISYRGRSAFRDAGKAMGLSLAQVDRLSRLLGSYDDLAEVGPEMLRQAGLELSPAVKETLDLAREMQGFPRHLSIHVGGFLITRRPLVETVPVEPAAMPGRTIVQWDKDDVAELGLLKVDLLGLGMLTALSRALRLLARHRLEPVLPTPVPHPASLAEIPAEDPAVYDMACRADTIGVFQIESRAQMSMLPRLKPRCFYDLVISVAIIRPGPIQGGMVHPYLRRRDGLEEVRYPYAPLGPVLQRTLGVPLFQEQAMRLAVVAAGFTPGEADELRRVMTHKRSHERMAAMKARLISGMAEKDISREHAEEIFRQLLGFSGYGFPESHAASFALLVYASAWIKRYHPAAFASALLDSQPMGFYAPHTLVEDAKRHGVAVRGVDVQFSDLESSLEGRVPGEPAGASGAPALRLGLAQVKGLPRATAEAIAAARRDGPFRSAADLARRAGLSRAWLSRLAEAGALRSLEPVRRRAIWRALGAVPGTSGDLFAGLEPEEPEADLPPASAAEEVAADFASAGLSEKAHPMSLLRPQLASRRIRSARELQRLPDRAAVEVAGMVIVRQRPETARGIVFVSLEDETGIANLVVMPDVYQRYRAAVRTEGFLQARGRVERNGRVVNVRVDRLAPLDLAPPVEHRARSFR